jgi:MFS family permease
VSRRAARRLPWALASFALALLVSGWVIAGFAVNRTVFISALVLVFSGVGALIASRHPGNPMGWIFLGVGMAVGLGTLASSYAEYWVEGHGGSRALGKTAAWYGNLSWIPFIGVPCTFVLLLFPDGRLLSRRWRWVAWCAGVGMAGTFITEGLHPGPIDDFPKIMNPYGIESPLLDPLTGIAFLVLLMGIVGSSASLVLRFRRAQGERRQQIKWLALAGAVAGVTVPIASVGSGLWGQTATNLTSMLGVLCLPLAAGIAILRYRLYDVDVVINRTLVYGALTATLAAAYLGSVLLLQLLLAPLTADSGLAIAASTLAVAALFRPARGRIQAAVDRRFYRRRYDAARTLEAFGGRLREELDLEALGADLRGVVRETVQPAHVSLWLRRAP